MTMEARGTDMQELYYEDIEVGGQILTGTHTVTMADVLTFADVTRDRHPLHTDEEHCRKTAFGRPIAHGLFGLSLIEGLKSELRLFENSSVASLGWDKVRFRKPLFPQDTVHVRLSFVSKRETSNGLHGVVVETAELIDQNGEVVLDGEHAALLHRRAPRT
jgi:acyl dehydratase